MSSSAAPPDPTPRWWQRRLPVWAIPVVIVATLLAAELGARVVGPAIPRTAGSEERLLVKADQIHQRGAGATTIAILGSSETAGGLFPEVFASEAPSLGPAYNAALSGFELTLMRQWSERIVLPRLDPDIVVIGMLPMTVMAIDPTGAEGPLAAIAAYEAALDQVDPGGLGSVSWTLRQHSDLIRYRPYLRSPSLAFDGARAAMSDEDEDPRPEGTAMDWTSETDPERVAANTAADGVVFDYFEPSPPIDGDPLGAALYNSFGEAPSTFEHLEALVETLRDRGVQPVIAVAPVDRTPLIDGGARMGPLDDVAAEIVAWGEANGVPVNEQFTRDWEPSMFHDRNHVARSGGKAWSREIATWLVGLCQAGTLERC